MSTKPLESYIAYTDGACSGNPGRGGWGCVILSPKGSIKELGGDHPSTTNNQMELMAVIECLKALKPTSPVILYTDSSYVLNGITKWIFGWIKKDWINSSGGEVANKELWQELHRLVKGREIDWRYCPGHAGVPGNERVDEIAVQFSKNIDAPLYFGPAKGYGIDLQELPHEVPIPSPSNRFSKEPVGQDKQYYLSYSNGVLRSHADWKGCEASTRGISGAKFKKIKTPTEETTTLKAWGFDPAKAKIHRH